MVLAPLAAPVVLLPCSSVQLTQIPDGHTYDASTAHRQYTAMQQSGWGALLSEHSSILVCRFAGSIQVANLAAPFTLSCLRLFELLRCLAVADIRCCRAGCH